MLKPAALSTCPDQHGDRLWESSWLSQRGNSAFRSGVNKKFSSNRFVRLMVRSPTVTSQRGSVDEVLDCRPDVECLRFLVRLPSRNDAVGGARIAPGS